MPLGFFILETPSFWGLLLVLLFRIPDLFAACFDFTVEVREGAMVVVVVRELKEAGRKRCDNDEDEIISEADASGDVG